MPELCTYFDYAEARLGAKSSFHRTYLAVLAGVPRTRDSCHTCRQYYDENLLHFEKQQTWREFQQVAIDKKQEEVLRRMGFHVKAQFVAIFVMAARAYLEYLRQAS